VKYLRYLFNLASLYPKLHLTAGGWEGGRVTVWTRFYWVHWELPPGCPSWGTGHGQQLQSRDELWPSRPEERSGEGKTCPYRRTKALGISLQNVCHRAGGSKEKGTGQAWHRRQLDRPRCPRNGSTCDARCLPCSASSPAPSIPAEGQQASPLQGMQPKTRGPSFKTVRTCPLLQAVKRGPATAAGGTGPCF